MYAIRSYYALLLAQKEDCRTQNGLIKVENLEKQYQFDDAKKARIFEQGHLTNTQPQNLGLLTKAIRCKVFLINLTYRSPPFQSDRQTLLA